MHLFHRGNIAGVILLRLYLQTSSTVNSGKLQDIGSTTVKICSLLRLKRKCLPLNPWIVQDIGLYSQLEKVLFYVIYPLWGWGEVKGELTHAVMCAYHRPLSQCVQRAALTVPQSRALQWVCPELGLCLLILVCTTSKYQFCWVEVGIRCSKKGMDEPVLIYSCSVFSSVVFSGLLHGVLFLFACLSGCRQPEQVNT